MVANSSMVFVPTTEDIVRAYYHELPNKAAAIAAICLYAAVTAVLLATTIKTRAWFMLFGAATGIIEVAGYVLRVTMLPHPAYYTYVVSYAFLVIAPVLLAIVQYVCVAKLIRRSAGARGSSFAKWVGWFMIVSEICCLGLQCAAGGPLTSKDDAKRDLGRKMMLTGLCLQIGFFSVFTGIALHVQLHPKFGYRGNKQFKKLFAALYATIVLIYIRNIFRVVEFAQGFFGYLATHEEFFYGFDFTIIFSVLLVFGVFNYGFAFSRDAATAEAATADDKAAASMASDHAIVVVAA